ncbi:S-layer homology domain-containing protein [Cohnella soli]|uniref:S-layer homology domain-containing protein n=1 Tax=Cohnella soli TaxID=425005 RepID=A0ABW0HXP4_9BACL
MKKKYFSLMTALLLFVMALAPAIVAVQKATAADDEWVDISTAAELDAIRSDNGLVKNYRLTADIDLSSYSSWDPIGVYLNKPFIGKFDGQGHTIANLRIDLPGTNNIGLFAYTKGATITNVHLTNVNIIGEQYVGGLVGQLSDSNLSSVSISGTVKGNRSVGGLVGYNDGSSISDSYTTGFIAGGTTPNSEFGGIAGHATFLGNTLNEFRNVYSNAEVYASSESGGLIGLAEGYPRVYNAYWDTQTSGRSTSSGGGTGRATAEMMHQTAFTGWDFTNTWGIVEGVTYPLSRSQYDSIALASLTVKNTANDAAIPLDRSFSGNYGLYKAQVISQVDHINIEGTAIQGTSAVSIVGNGGSNTVALVPGENVIAIRVTAYTGLTADYKLTVTRDAGTAQIPHRITTAAQLADIGKAGSNYVLTQTYRLDADLDLSNYASGSGWLPIGSSASPFKGVFDGNHHTIAHLTINRPGTDDVGLFGNTDGATITGLALTNANVTGHDHVGGLIGTSNDTLVSHTAVQGEVYGNDKVAGLIGSQSGAGGSVDYSYSTAKVEAPVGSMTGGLVAHSVGATVSRSFWDMDTSRQAQSDGGGTGKTTNEMKKKATYAADGWLFGNGQSWDMIEDTGYPVPLSSFANVTLSGLMLSTPGATHTLGSFSTHTGAYTATLSTPVTTAAITATPTTAGASVTFNGSASSSLNLHLGSNLIDVLVTAPDGASQGLYRLTLTVPTPQMQSVQVPADGMYGVGQELDFTVTYDHPVDVTGTPTLPIRLNGTDTAAVYAGQPPGQSAQLTFTYIVKAGDLDSDGITVGSVLKADAPAAITAIGDSVPLALAGVPSLSGVLIDGVAPTIGLTRSTTAPTNGPLKISVAADGTGSALASLRWAPGDLTVGDFADPLFGTAVPVSNEISVTENGKYTVYAADSAGNKQSVSIAITNIVAPTSNTGPPTLPAGQFQVVPGQSYTLTFGTLTLHIPANAITQPMIISLKDATGDAEKLLGQGQKLYSNAFSLTKSVPGTFAAPVTLKLQANSSNAVAGQRIILFYYDESAKQWKPLPSKSEGNTIAGETDHFTLFAALSVPTNVETSFTDVAGHWAEKDILSSAGQGWVSGYPDGTFLPNKAVTRAEFAVMLSKTLRLPPAADLPFTDAKAIPDWAAASVAAATKAGILSGYGDRSFRPEVNITRAEAAAMIVRAAGLPALPTAATGFADDANIANWAKGWISAAAGANLMQGQGKNVFHPQATTTRAEAAVLLQRLAAALQ